MQTTEHSSKLAPAPKIKEIRSFGIIFEKIASKIMGYTSKCIPNSFQDRKWKDLNIERYIRVLFLRLISNIYLTYDLISVRKH